MIKTLKLYSLPRSPLDFGKEKSGLVLKMGLPKPFLGTSLRSDISQYPPIKMTPSSRAVLPISASFPNLDVPILPDPYKAFLPIILGEIQETANVPLALLNNIDFLAENNVTHVAVQPPTIKKHYKEYALLDFKENFSEIKKYIEEDILKTSFVSDIEYGKLLVWFTDKNVKNLLNSVKDGNYVSLLDTEKFRSDIDSFGNEISALARQFITAVDEKKLNHLYETKELNYISPLDIARFICAKKKIHSLYVGEKFDALSLKMKPYSVLLENNLRHFPINKKKQYINDLIMKNFYKTGTLDIDAHYILQDQAMIEEVQELVQTFHGVSNILAVMAVPHLIALKTHYPDSAVFINMTGMEEPSLSKVREILRGQDEIDSNPRKAIKIDNIDLKNCFKDALQPRDLNPPAVERSDEVLEVLKRLKENKALTVADSFNLFNINLL